MKQSLVVSTMITTGAFACVLVMAGSFRPASGGNTAIDPGVRGGPAGAGGITQGSAGPDEFRTAPLWGIGQRVYFLHDGRTKNLMEAIETHASPGSEANQVILNFNSLSESDQQNVLNFLRSL